MASGSPWAQPGNELGWGQGEGAIDPPTRQQQQEQENLELAIEAAAAVAPELIAEEQRQGGGGQQVEYQTDGMGQQAQGGDEPTVQVDTSLGAPPKDTTLSAPATSQGSQGVPTWVRRSPSMQSMLGPLTQPNAVSMLRQAVRSGQARLNAELHRFYGTQRTVSATALGMRDFHFALPMLLELAEEIGRDARLRAEVEKMRKRGFFDSSRISGRSLDRCRSIIDSRMRLARNPWESMAGGGSVPWSQGEESLQKAIMEGLKSSRFRSLMDDNELNLNNFNDKIKAGEQSRYWGPPEDFIEINVRNNSYDVLAITQELTNRKYKDVHSALDQAVETGEISFDDYSAGILGIELNGIVNKIIVAAELGIAYSSVQNLVDYYAIGELDEASLFEYLRPVIESAIIKDTQLPAKEHYRQMGERKRARYLRIHGK